MRDPIEEELAALTEGERASVRFAAQQDVVHEWAQEVYIDNCIAEQIAALLSYRFGLKCPALVWEAAGVLELDVHAAAIRNARTGERSIFFRGLGCTLLTLCHELVHCFRDWHEPHHDYVDWDVATILLEESRDLI